MRKANLSSIAFLLLALLFASLACQAAAAPAATSTATETAVPPTTTATTPPTSTPRPTATPNLAATQAAEADQATLQGYLDKGYISTMQGTLYPLTDNTRDMAQINFLDYDYSGYDNTTRNFAAWADLKWSSAAPVNYPEFSGCGFGFRMQNNGDAYTAMVTNDSVLVTWCFEAFNGCGRVGKTSGKGTVKLPNPAQAHFEFIVNDTQAFALVNGDLIAKYTLFKDRLVEPGYFTYSIISGTNKDYGTRCTVSNGKIWVPNE